MKPKANKPENMNFAKALLLKEYKQSIKEVNLAKAGKLKLKTADQLLEELNTTL